MAVHEQGSDAAATEGRSLSAAVSTRMVQLIREYTGRGPTMARTYVHPNAIVCVLQDNLTKGERAIVDHVGEAAVLDQRKAFQAAMRADATALVQDLTGRTVAAFLSDNHIDPDVAVEVFILEPANA